MLDRYSQQRVNEAKHNPINQQEELVKCFRDWDKRVKTIKEAFKEELGKAISENTIIEAYLALVSGLTSNINTSIVQFSKLYEEKLGSFDAIEKACEIIPFISNFGFPLEAYGSGEIQRVSVNTNIKFESLLADKEVKFPMLVQPRKVHDNYHNGWISTEKSLLIGKAKKHKKYLNYDAINTISKIPLKIRKDIMIKELNEGVNVDRFNKQGFKKDYSSYKLEVTTAKLINERTIDFIKTIGSGEFYHNYSYDGRGRLYVVPSILNYQQDSKHLITLANTEKLNDDGIDNLKIDLANQYGEATPDDLECMAYHWMENKDIYPGIMDIEDVQMKGDKSTWTQRLLFGDTFFSGETNGSYTVSKLVKDTDEPKLYQNSLDCLMDYFNDRSTGHLVGLDATTSCAQIISLSMGDKVGMINSNVIMEKDIRNDFYQIMSDTCNGDIERKRMKKAVMPSLYNSSAKPKEVFPDEVDLEVFYEARLEALPSCEEFLGICNDELWDEESDEHTWTLPDGHTVSVRSYYKDYDEFEIETDDIETTIAIQFRNYGACDYNIPLAAK